MLFIAGSVISFNNAPVGDDRPAKYVAYYSDSGHRDKINIGWLLVVLGVFFFPQALIAIWILVAGWLVFRASNRPLGAPPAPAAPVA